jgi:hypothetical protein
LGVWSDATEQIMRLITNDGTPTSSEIGRVSTLTSLIQYTLIFLISIDIGEIKVQ